MRPCPMERADPLTARCRSVSPKAQHADRVPAAVRELGGAMRSIIGNACRLPSHYRGCVQSNCDTRYTLRAKRMAAPPWNRVGCRDH
jgi:hypothetical protein